MIACRLRTFAKCQRPKSGDNTEEGWTGMETEPSAFTYIHTCTQNAEKTSRCASQTLHCRITWPFWSLIYYIVQCASLIMRRLFGIFSYVSFVYFSWRWLPWFGSLSPNNQWLAVVWSLAIGQTNMLLMTKATRKDCAILYAYQQRDFIWKKTWLDWNCLPLLLSDRFRSPILNSPPQLYNLWSLPLFIYYKSYVCSDMKKLLILASVCTHLCCVRPASATRYLRWMKDIALYLR